MRVSRFLLPFGLGAFSVLVVVAAAERVAPGVLGRAGSALHPAAAGPAAPLSGVVTAPTGSAAEAPPGAPVDLSPPLPVAVAPGGSGR